jgi:hypothetical protein
MATISTISGVYLGVGTLKITALQSTWTLLTVVSEQNFILFVQSAAASKTYLFPRKP